MMAVTPASSKRSARSSARTVLCLVQPSTATRPSRASMPTAIWPGHCRQAALTRPGSLTATVPRMTRRTPASIHWAMLSMVRMPPPSWAGTATAFRMLCTAARLTGWPSTAPLRSTRCSHSQPALANALAWAAGLSLNTVARAMSPRSRRTHLPSLRSMAGKRSMAAAGLARPVGGRHPHGYSPAAQKDHYDPLYTRSLDRRGGRPHRHPPRYPSPSRDRLRGAAYLADRGRQAHRVGHRDPSWAGQDRRGRHPEGQAARPEDDRSARRHGCPASAGEERLRLRLGACQQDARLRP